MSSNDKHSPHNHRGISKISNNLIFASVATVGVTAGLTINQVTVSAANEDATITVSQSENSAPMDPNETDQPPSNESEAPATLSDHYTNAQNQVNDANGKADTVNNSLIKLQRLLNNPDLTSQTDWQTTLQNAMNEYQNNATKFSSTTDNTQELINAYQTKINETIKDQPNAVNQVTDTETTGTHLSDYQQLTDSFKKNVTDQLQIVQTNLDNYAVSDQVNQASASLTSAADALNNGLTDSTMTSSDLESLKTTYDAAVTEYNTAVTAYNDKSGSTMATISLDDIPDITQILADIKVKESYAIAVDAHQNVQDKVDPYQDAVKSWQDAVKAYNDALAGLRMPDRADDTDLKAAQKAVEDAANKITEMQENYNTVILNPDNKKIISDYLNVSVNYPTEFEDYTSAQDDYDKKLDALKKAEDALSVVPADKELAIKYAQEQVEKCKNDLTTAEETMKAAEQVVTNISAPYKLKYDDLLQAEQDVIQPYNSALVDLQDKLATWQAAYGEYNKKVISASNSEQTLPDFDKLQESVDTAQTEVEKTLGEIGSSQSEYKLALDSYQTALDNDNLDIKSIDGTLPDLSALQKELTEKFTQNTDVMNATPKLLAFINAEFQLQQRIVQINNIVLAINSDQEMLKTIYNAAYQGDSWSVLTSKFKSIGNDLAEKTINYETAVNGEGLSYADLVKNLEDARADYDTSDITYTYPNVADVNEQYETFNTHFTNFKTSYNSLLEFLAKSAPNEEYNAAAVENMKDGTKLSTDGVSTNIEDIEDGTSNININTYLGKDLDYFVGRSNIDLYSDKFGDYGYNSVLKIEQEDKISAESAAGTKYYSVSPDRLAELSVILHGMIVSSFEKDGITYHLTGLKVPGTGTGSEGITDLKVNNLSEIYSFTSLDPIKEIMSMFTGINVNVNANTMFLFFYTASPQKGSEDTTNLTDEDTLPKLKSFSTEILDSSGDWNSGSLISGSEITNPTPNKSPDSSGTVTGTYSGGETIDNSFDVLTIKQAPTITLNEVKGTPDPGNPGTTDPSDPGTPDPGNPGTTDPSDPGTSNPGNPDTTNTNDPGPDGTVQVPSNNNGAGYNDIVYVPKTGQFYDSTDKISHNDQNNLNKTAKTLPQMGQKSKGIWALLGSLLLAISGLSLINFKKKE
ncbi:coiled-coil domain-containing protein [Companilactobacillus keshanensis]|uniref:Gram-positive cocci surface proteins LPxTG domain-containing protein n=1 Tax=Companilactobacillus keshanensis TaxID=2486003 RepID=A0ABW4BT26_9LACO|nr:hypothetical protein [Companilactobacillus keshanensis]